MPLSYARRAIIIAQGRNTVNELAVVKRVDMMI